MIHRLLVIVAIVCCGLVSASFIMFGRDQLAGASIHQQNEINYQTTTQQNAPATAVHHGQPRRFIDGAAGKLESPFQSIVHSSSQWASRGVPTILALLLYGVALGYLARFSSGSTRSTPRHRPSGAGLA